MEELDAGKAVTLEELVVLTLAMVDTVSKILIKNGVISEAEFGEKLLEERAVYHELFNSPLQ